MIDLRCQHCKTELILEKDERTPSGLLRCPKCKCTFRVTLAFFDKKCYGKMYPSGEKEK
jgi:hypothetical protein